MPALAKPKHEAFAQALFAGMDKRGPLSQGQAYKLAGYNVTNGNSARACASRLLTFANGIGERVRELQAEQLSRLTPKLDLSKERVGRRLDLASQIAEQERNAAAIATSELGIAKVFGHLVERHEAVKNTDYSQCQSMDEIGRKLLAQVGISSPSPTDIADAIAANDALVAALEAIAERSQTLMIEG